LKDDLKHLHSGIFKAVGEIFESISERLLDIQYVLIFFCVRSDIIPLTHLNKPM